MALDLYLLLCTNFRQNIPKNRKAETHNVQRLLHTKEEKKSPEQRDNLPNEGNSLLIISFMGLIWRVNKELKPLNTKSPNHPVNK